MSDVGFELGNRLQALTSLRQLSLGNCLVVQYQEGIAHATFRTEMKYESFRGARATACGRAAQQQRLQKTRRRECEQQDGYQQRVATKSKLGTHSAVCCYKET